MTPHPTWKAVRDADVAAVHWELAVLDATEVLQLVTESFPPIRWGYALWYGFPAKVRGQVEAAEAALAAAEEGVSDAEKSFLAAIADTEADPDLALALHATHWARRLCRELADSYGVGGLVGPSSTTAHDLLYGVLRASRRVSRVAGWVDGHGKALEDALVDLEESLYLTPDFELTMSNENAADHYAHMKVQAKRERRALEVATVLAELDSALHEAVDALQAG